MVERILCKDEVKGSRLLSSIRKEKEGCPPNTMKKRREKKRSKPTGQRKDPGEEREKRRRKEVPSEGRGKGPVKKIRLRETER